MPKEKNDGPFMEDVKGLVFHNPKDNCEQVLKQKDGCLICYDAPGRKEKISQYIEQHPETFNNSIHLNKFIKYLKENVVNEGGKADLWDTDVNFAAGLKDAPAKEDIKVGPTGTPQMADKDGAYLVKDGNGIRMVQKAEFLKAYSVTKVPTMNGRQFVHE